MADESAAEDYRQGLREAGQQITLQRTSGVAPNVTTTSATVKAKVADYTPDLSVVKFSQNTLGEIIPGKRQIIVSGADLREEGFPLPVMKNDQVLIGSDELNILSVDPYKRQFADAIEIVAESI